MTHLSGYEERRDWWCGGWLVIDSARVPY